MKLSDFFYKLPPSLIAQHPVERRDQSRLMVVDRKDGSIQHTVFSEILHYLLPGDLLVMNDTKVFPARLTGRKTSGGKVEMLLLRKISQNQWETLIKGGAKIRVGTKILLGQGQASGIVTAKLSQGKGLIDFSCEEGEFLNFVRQYGEVPLPPYIKRDQATPLTEEDRERYQTVYARYEGSIAAPTAGLHFTQELLQKIVDHQITIASLTLHVGWGTFNPIRADEVEEHHMESEVYEISEEVAHLIHKSKERHGRAIAVGTTTTRALESASDEKGNVRPGQATSDLFIYPGYRFKVVDTLVTNFHLPGSTLLLLVSAFAGRELILNAYREAIAHQYRFYSYGDAMLIL